MRLTKNEVSTIKSAVHQLDPNALIFLFGSRVHDHKKGGDIDLLILSEILNFFDKAKIKTSIFEHIEEQRIDISIAKDDSDPFVKIALEEGIAL